MCRTQAETIRPGKTNCTREANSSVQQCLQTSSAVTNLHETTPSTSTKLRTPLEDSAANNSQKALENIVQSSQNSTENGNVQLERRRDNNQSVEETDNNNLKNSSELGNSVAQLTPRASKPVAAVTGTSRNSPGKSNNKTDSGNDGPVPSAASSVAVTDVASQTPPLSISSSQTGIIPTESTTVVDTPPTYPKRKLSRKQSNKVLRHQNTESNTAKKSDNDRKEAKSTQEKTKPEKEVVLEKEDAHEQVVVVVKEKARDKVKPFTKDAGTGQAIPVEDAPHEGGIDAEDDIDDVGKKDLSAKGKDKKKRSRVPPKREEKENKRKKERELELMEFIKSKRLSSESIEVESTTSTENLDDENQSGDSDEKQVKSGNNSTTDNKEDIKNTRPNDSPTGQSALVEEEASKEQPVAEPQANDNQTKRSEKKTLQLEILADPFSRKPDKTSYNSKKIVSTSKKQSTERTKSASSEEPDDSKPPTPVGGTKIRIKNKQSDGEATGKAEEQDAKSPESSKVGDSVRVTTPHEIAASLLIKNPAITTRSKMKVERETKEQHSKCEVHPTTKSPPLGKPNEMLPVEGYPFMPANMPQHHPRYLDVRADFNRQDQSGPLSLHAEPFIPNMPSKDHYYDDPRQMNRMEVSRGKTLGDYMPPSVVTQPSRHHYAKKQQENMFADNKFMFEDPRAMRHNMMPPVQQKVSPTMNEDSPMYHPVNYHPERMGHDPHFNYRYSNPADHHHEPYFEEDYSGLQSFDQQLVSRNARPNNLQYNLPEEGVSFHSSGMSGSHNIISASGRKGMSMMQGGGLTLTSPTSMFESPKKQQPPSVPNYQRPPPGHPMSGGAGSDENFRLSHQHYIQQLHIQQQQQQLKASKQLHRMPPPGLGDPHLGEMMQDRRGSGGISWGAADDLGNDPMNISMQHQHHLREQQQQQQQRKRQQYLMQQQQQQQQHHLYMDDYGDMLPSLQTSAASPVFSPSLNLAPGSGFSSSVYERKSSPLDLGWDNSKNRDNVSYFITNCIHYTIKWLYSCVIICIFIFSQ